MVAQRIQLDSFNHKQASSLLTRITHPDVNIPNASLNHFSGQKPLEILLVFVVFRGFVCVVIRAKDSDTGLMHY